MAVYFFQITFDIQFIIFLSPNFPSQRAESKNPLYHSHKKAENKTTIGISNTEAFDPEKCWGIRNQDIFMAFQQAGSCCHCYWRLSKLPVIHHTAHQMLNAKSGHCLPSKCSVPTWLANCHNIKTITYTYLHLPFLKEG